MKEQPHWTNILTPDFFTKYYVEQRMSYPKIRAMLVSQGHCIGTGTIQKYAKSLGFGRNRSEAKRNIDPNPLDYNTSFLDERTIDAVDGFLLGDGNIAANKGMVLSARLQCGVEYEEFSKFLMKPFYNYATTTASYKHTGMSSGFMWVGQSKYHPDLYIQYDRWYKNDIKQPPDDVRITPVSVMMWYLGDGSVVVNEKNNSIMLRLSTDGFSPERVEFLSSKLQEKEIECHRNNDNRIMIDARGIPKFFEFIGRKSPVACYSYKFELPEWRFQAKRMSEVAEELGINYNRLAHLVKINKVQCYRASEKGRPRFLKEHINYIKANKVQLGL